MPYYPCEILRPEHHYLENRTAIFDPDGRCVPGAGDCSRAIPLPITFNSNPDCCADSTAERNGFPMNEGTTAPLSTLRTTIPFSCAGCGSDAAHKGELSWFAVVSVCPSTDFIPGY